MEKELINRITASGYKKKYIALTIGITPVYLSMCMSGKRNLSKSKTEKIKAIL